MKKLRLNSQVRRAFRGRSRGFSLIEVSIAIALIGIVVVGILSALSYASMVLIIADRRATAESLAKSQIEYIKNQPYIDYSDPEHNDYNRITTLDGEEYGIELDVDTVLTGLQKVTVIISYDIVRPGNKVVEEQYTVAGYKRQPADYTEV